MRIGLATDPRFRAHRAPGEHPERPARLEAIEGELEAAGLRARMVERSTREASRAQLERAHEGRYLDELERRLAGASEGGWLDDDTFYSAGSWEAALLAAGTVTELAQAVARRELDGALALVRPPGHHATARRAMGFCLINNVAVAAAGLVADGARVAIVDFDVHHGNGTQDIFFGDGRVLYCSSHQSPLYPGTGAVEERGEGRGRGATVNVPLPSGAGDEALLAAYDEVVLPAIERFRPDVLLASAGFDAHADDPLASLRVTERGFARLARRLRQACGAFVFTLEGGYDLGALGRSVAAVAGALLDEREPEREAPGVLRPVERAAIDRARASLADVPVPAP